MIKIGLDLAYRSCGVAIITENRLFYTSHNLSKDKGHCSEVVHRMADWVFTQVQPYLSSPHILVMEDIFKGRWENLKNIARVQGAIMDRYAYHFHGIPELVSAITARNRVNIHPQAPKVAIQLWVLATFKLDKKIDQEYKDRIEGTILTYSSLIGSNRKADKKRLKMVDKELEKQTNKVAEITGLDNHSADAIVLALGAGT